MNKIKILIVEDDESLRNLYEHSVTDELFEKRFAGDSNDALAIYKPWQPDIIVLDLYLPDIPGCSVLETIRKDHDDSSTTIIVSTSSDSKSDIENCNKLGIQGYIIKPFKPSEISMQILNCYRELNPEKAEAALDLL